LLTLSLGVGTVVPGPHQTAVAFIEKVDGLLYHVKRNGRMRAEYGEF
jgi:PleD family two-component response regulator